MIDVAMNVEGIYFDGRKPVGLPVPLSFLSEEATMTGSGIAKTYPTACLTVTPVIGRADRFVNLPDGGQVLCAFHPALNLLKRESPTEGPVAWLEERVRVAGGCVALIAALLLSAYVFGLPVAADWAVTKVSITTEQSLGNDALAWLEKKKWLQPTGLDEIRMDRIRRTFSSLTRGLNMEPNYHLEFRQSKQMGANAIALPGGLVVITDEMVMSAESGDEIAAVLAHEIGHIELRHTMKQVMQGSALAVIAGVVTNDASSYTVAVAGLPALLAQAHYSREFESEADEFAFKLLKQHHISPAAFASLMERLSKGHEDEEKYVAFLSTHPLTADRVKRARQESGR